MAKILNTVLSMIGIFLLCFLWIVYCTKNTLVAAWLSAIVALAAAYLIYRAQSEWSARKNSKRAETKKISALANMLRFGENNAELVGEMMRYYRFDAQNLGQDDLVAHKNGNTYYAALRYAADSASREEVVRAVVAAKRAKACKLFLFAHKADKSVLEWASEEMPVSLVDVANLYALLEQADRLPELTYKKSHPITHFLPKFAFNRRRFGWYAATSLFMLALTMVSFVKWYTLGWATVSMLLGVYCLVNKRYNASPTAVTLD